MLDFLPWTEDANTCCWLRFGMRSASVFRSHATWRAFIVTTTADMLSKLSLLSTRLHFRTQQNGSSYWLPFFFAPVVSFHPAPGSSCWQNAVGFIHDFPHRNACLDELQHEFHGKIYIMIELFEAITQVVQSGFTIWRFCEPVFWACYQDLRRSVAEEIHPGLGVENPFTNNLSSIPVNASNRFTGRAPLGSSRSGS